MRTFYYSGIVAYYVKIECVWVPDIPYLYSNGKSDFLVIFKGENTLLEWNWSVFDRFSRWECFITVEL